MANTQLQTRIILKNDTAANWSTSTLVPLKGEFCVESDTRKIKIGDGTNVFKDLKYANLTPEEINQAISNSAYTLPTASASQLGGVKIGTNINNSSGTISVADASTSTKGVVQLEDSTSSTSVTTAATPKSVKAAYDLASNAMPKSGGTFTGAVTLNADPTANLGAATKQYVDQQITDKLAASDAMVFKGTLGTSGTITALPTTEVVEGDTYKVITAGTYAGNSCKVGDLLIALNSGDVTADSTNWAYVPSGNENETTIKYSTTTQNLTTSAQTGEITLAEGATKQVDTSIDAGSTSTKLPTSAAVASFVEGKGYTTNVGTITGISTSAPLSGSGTSGSVTISHATSGATAGSYGDSAAQTPSYGSTFKVPYLTVTKEGHVSEISEHTVTIPASDNTDTKVTQTSSTTNAAYPLLAASAASPTSGDASTAVYNTGVTVNPSTKTVTATKFVGNLTGTADAAGALSSSAGSATQPVYINSEGKPAACTYELKTSVPANAVFTDTTYSDMTGATSSSAGTHGLVPAPAAGDQAKFLRADGTWVVPTDTNTDTKVTQTVTTTSANYPLLLAPTGQTATTTTTANFGTKFQANPSTGVLTATTFSGALSGNASTATEFSETKEVKLTGDVTGNATSKAGWSITTAIASCSTDKLVQGENTLIFDCGNASA